MMPKKLRDGLVNTVVAVSELEAETVSWLEKCCATLLWHFAY